MIRDQTHDCLRNFELLAETAELSLIEKVKEQAGRFKLWASNIGVFAGVRLSLDYRLRDDPDISEAVEAVLLAVRARIQAVSSAVDGQDRHAPAAALIGDPHPTSATMATHRELNALAKTITRLHKLSLAIRRARSPQSLLHSARTEIESDSRSGNNLAQNNEEATNFKDFMFEILKHRYQALSAESLTGLVDIAWERRKKFQYRASHQSRLSCVSERGTHSAYREDQTQIVKPLDTISQSESQASSFDREKFNLDYSPSEDSSLQQSSTTHGDENFPAAPGHPIGSSEGECPYCFWILPSSVTSDRASWKRHVEEDLQPYVCLHKSCIQLPRCFTSRKDWIYHVNHEHPDFWICPICCNQVVLAGGQGIAQHFKLNHGRSLSTSQMETLLRRVVKKERSILDTSCPLCGAQSVKSMAEHVADHLLDIALMSLPLEEEENEEDGKRVHKQKYSRQDTSTHILSRTENLAGSDRRETGEPARSSPDANSTELHSSQSSRPQVNLVSEPPQWTWSRDHQRYYYVTYDPDTNPVFHWDGQQNTQAGAQQQSLPDPAYQQSDTYQSQQAEAYSSPQQGLTYQFPESGANSQVQRTEQARQNLQSPQQPLLRYNSHGSSSHAGSSYVLHTRVDSSSQVEPDNNAADMPPPIPSHIRHQLQELIPGTPQRGWYEALDSSYSMRTGWEAHQFFKKGRVFSMLWSEAASETAARLDNPDGTVRGYNDAYTVGRFGQAVYSQIRRFVVMRVKKKEHFVYACPITTYSGRATTKNGCNPKEHTIVYFTGSSPQYTPGERGNGMIKEPIEIRPSESHAIMEPSSRLRFGKTYPVEWNVKVKDIGQVVPEHMSKLIAYWKQEDHYDSDDPEEQSLPSTFTY